MSRKARKASCKARRSRVELCREVLACGPTSTKAIASATGIDITAVGTVLRTRPDLFVRLNPGEHCTTGRPSVWRLTTPKEVKALVPVKKPQCRHCGKKPESRPRGLCCDCYYTPGVKKLYPSTSVYARRGHGNFTGNAPLADSPTTAAPGTPDKVAVMEQRAKMKQAIFHPADARYEGDPLPLDFMRQQSARGRAA